MDRDAAAATTAEQLRRADALDPDVRTDKEGNRLDGDADPVETPAEASAAERDETPAAERAATGFGASSAARDADHSDHDHGLHGEHGHEHTHAYGGDDASGGRIGNMRGLDEDDDTVAEPDRGSSDEAHAEQGQPLHIIGNMRGVDDDDDETRVTPVTPEPVATTGETTTHETTTHETTDETVTGGDTVGDDRLGGGEKDNRDGARERADEVLAKRDAEAERRQPE
jgi:hypothetical protein